MAPASHPVIDEVLRRLQKGAGGALELGRGSIEELKGLVVRRFGQEELRLAVETLTRLAWFLEEKRGSPSAASGIMEVAASMAPTLAQRQVRQSPRAGFQAISGEGASTNVVLPSATLDWEEPGKKSAQ